MGVIRRPAVAGAFYPAEPEALARGLGRLLSEAVPPVATGAAALPKALIVPHAGYAYSGPVAARAYARLAAARGRIQRVVLIGPSHHVAFRGLALDTAEAWQLPLGTVALDTDGMSALRGLPMVGTLDAAFAREHALEVQVPFLQQVLGDFRLLPIVTGEAPPEAVAMVLDAAWGGLETLVVASSDLSHYLDYESCGEIDARTAAAIEALDGAAIAEEGACGRVALRGLLLAARRHGLVAQRLDLRNSGDTAGPRDRVVGYGAWALLSRPNGAAHEDGDEDARIVAHGPLLLDLARAGLAVGFATGSPGELSGESSLPALLRAPGAAFVTLRRNGWLRGCIGSPVARRMLARDVVQHAFNAAFRDPRFPKLGLLEVAGLELSVSVLTPPVPMQFADERELLASLRPGVDGLIIGDAGRAALFLPSVWAELPDPRQFLAALKRKAGLRPDHFSPGFTARRFRSVEVKGGIIGGPGLRGSHDEFAWTRLHPRI